MTFICRCCRLSLAAGGISSAQWLEHVPANLDALTAARDAAAKLRALAFAAVENRVSSGGDERLNGEIAAYSLISGYGF